MCELRRAAGILKKTLPGNTVKRLMQADVSSLVLICVDSRKNKNGILLSCDHEFARVCFVEITGSMPSPTGSFYEFLRAHITGTVVYDVEIASRNRQIALELRSREDRWILYLSVLGARSNLYLVDGRGLLVHSMRPLEETRRDLNIGKAWTEPPGSVPSEGEDRWAAVADEGYLGAIGEEYARLEIRRGAQTLSRRISQILSRERSLLGRKLNRLQEDLANARLAETFRDKGELLKTVLHTIKQGDTSVSVSDYKTGNNVEIPIDPRMSPAENLEAYFARYQKNSRGAEIIRQQIHRLEGLRDEIDSVECAVNSAVEKDPPDREELEKIKSTPLIRRLINRYAPKQRKEGTPAKSKSESRIPARLRPKRYRTEEGLEIWVGRNDEGNDYLTTRMARGNDLFFHLEGYPGSHVILRTEGRSDPPSDSVLDACELAVHFSKMKNAAKADVHITPIKNVRKPRGAKPGLVYVRQGKTIRLRRDPGRLQNILASRVDM